MARLSLALLGPLDVSLDGQSITSIAYAKVWALLAYLAVEVDRPHRRDALIGLLHLQRGEPLLATYHGGHGNERMIMQLDLRLFERGEPFAYGELGWLRHNSGIAQLSLPRLDCQKPLVAVCYLRCWDERVITQLSLPLFHRREPRDATGLDRPLGRMWRRAAQPEST